MVLTAAVGDAGTPGVPRRPTPWPRRLAGRPRLAAEAGSQTVEAALTVPVIVLLLLLVVHAGLLGADLVAAQSLAREAARAAALGDDDDAAAAVDDAGGSRPVRLTLDPPAGDRVPGDLVTADLEVRSLAFGAVGVDVWLPARAVMRVEHP